MMTLPAKTGLSGPLGTGKQWWSWVGLEDAVAAIEHVLSTPAIQGPVNIVAPEPIRQADFQRVLCKVLNRPAVIPAPAFGVRLILGKFADEVLSSKRVVPEYYQVVVSSGPKGTLKIYCVRFCVDSRASSTSPSESISPHMESVRS